MGVFYADSSVLVKRHVMEEGTHWFRNIVAHEHDNLVISSQLSEVEVCSAFARRTREAGLPKEALQQMMAAFERVCIAEYRIVPMSDAVVQQAKRLLAVYSLRAHDSIQLASAILVNNQFKHSGDGM